MILTVAAIWLGLAVLAAVFVAALGRSALREDEARGLLPTPSGSGVARPPEDVSADEGSRPAALTDHGSTRRKSA